MNSTSTVDATASPVAAGSSTLAGANKLLTLFGLSFPFPDNPPPNHVIFTNSEVTITLNAQRADPAESAGLDTDAVQFLFDKFPVEAPAPPPFMGGTTVFVSGSVEIGQSFASINVANVPEASTWAMMLVGFAGLSAAYVGARRRLPA
jgi:hypothetical protein